MQNNTKLVRIVTVPLSFKHLIKGQPAFFKSKGYEVTLISNEGSERADVEKFENLPYVIMPLTRTISPLVDFRALRMLIGYFKKHQPQIVHTQTPKAGLLGMLAAKLAGVPKRVHTVGGLPIVEAKGFKRLILSVTEKITSACATQVLINSYNLANTMVAMKLCSAKKLHVLGYGSSNGIDSSFFSPDAVLQTKQSLREQNEIPLDAFVLVFIGRVVRDKGMAELAHAFEKLYQSNSKVRLIIVGPPEDDLDPLDDSTWKILKTHPGIRLLGYQSDVRPYLKMSDLLVFPSYREGFPNVPLQAGAMEIPSIVSDINGCNEIISPGKNGWIVPVKDAEALFQAMKYALLHQEELEVLKKQARWFVQQYFDQQFIWNQIYAVYKENSTRALTPPPAIIWN